MSPGMYPGGLTWVPPTRGGPYQVVKDLEQALCEYTGAPYAVTVNSCTMALLLAVAWHLRTRERSAYSVLGDTIQNHPAIEIPKRTYVSVPQSIIHAGGRPTFRDEDWRGFYQLKPLPVWDCARWFTSQMFKGTAFFGQSQYSLDWLDSDYSREMLCVSFHASKVLGHSQGGAILHDNLEADRWLRRARFDGRTEGVAPNRDHFDMIGHHCYMSADVAAALLVKLHSLPRHNAPLPNDDYPDLSAMEIFR